MLGPHIGPGDVMEIGVSPCESLRPFVLCGPSSRVWLAAAGLRNKPQDINEMAGDACTGPGGYATSAQASSPRLRRM